ncbi:MAG: hypothetical protein IKN73_01840 [Alphaproteobacteria bacterium]|nr:hypothetical protein [Alphaproteobacteria bacterium]
MKKNIIILSLLFTQPALAWINDNVVNGCSIPTIYIKNGMAEMQAVFEPNKYTCEYGFFLPANVPGCRPCPIGFTCDGGTYTFNETVAQGISGKPLINTNITNICSNNILNSLNNKSILISEWTPNEHTCAPGYYLPANVDSCTICPAGNKCVGGTYSFNETDNQGIVSCNDYFAPIGSTNCYQHILHIGNDVVYLSSTKHTTPSLNVAYGNNVFYANMTTTQTVMTAGSQHYFKTVYNGMVYYICDDTSCPQ